MYAKRHTDLSSLTIHTHTQPGRHTHSHTNTLPSPSLPLGVNTFFYLVDIYRHRINSFPFPRISPWSWRHCSVGRNDLLDEHGTSVSPITKPTNLWNHRWRESNLGQQQCPIDKLVLKSNAAIGPFVLSSYVYLWHFRCKSIQKKQKKT